MYGKWCVWVWAGARQEVTVVSGDIQVKGLLSVPGENLDFILQETQLDDLLISVMLDFPFNSSSFSYS